MPSFDKGQTTEQNKIVDSGKSGKDSDNPAAKATATPAPTSTPYAFTPSDVTKTMKKEMKPLTERLKPFWHTAHRFMQMVPIDLNLTRPL